MKAYKKPSLTRKPEEFQGIIPAAIAAASTAASVASAAAAATTATTLMGRK